MESSNINVATHMHFINNAFYEQCTPCNNTNKLIYIYEYITIFFHGSNMD